MCQLFTEMSIWSFLKEPKPVRNSASVEKGLQACVVVLWGDQYVSVNVVTPTGLNDKQKEALQAFAEASDLKVNPKKKGFFDKVKDALDDL